MPDLKAIYKTITALSAVFVGCLSISPLAFAEHDRLSGIQGQKPAGLPVGQSIEFHSRNQDAVNDRNGMHTIPPSSGKTKVSGYSIKYDKSSRVSQVLFENGEYLNFEYQLNPSSGEVEQIIVSNVIGSISFSSADGWVMTNYENILTRIQRNADSGITRSSDGPKTNDGDDTPLQSLPKTHVSVSSAAFGELANALNEDHSDTSRIDFNVLKNVIGDYQTKQEKAFHDHIANVHNKYYKRLQFKLEETLGTQFVDADSTHDWQIAEQARSENRAIVDQTVYRFINRLPMAQGVAEELQHDIVHLHQRLMEGHVRPSQQNFVKLMESNASTFRERVKDILISGATSINQSDKGVEIVIYLP